MNPNPYLARIGTFAALTGAILLLIGTLLHPGDADPNMPVAAFTEYATSHIWLLSHLTQFLGVFGLSLGFAAFSSTLETGLAKAWSQLGLVGTAVIIAVAAALQAVDGVALKFMVDRWIIATGEARTLAFEAAFAVRQIEVGLASFFSITSGLTIMLFGMALTYSKRYPKWLGWIGLINGLGMVASGITQGSTGFSEAAMNLSMTTSIILLVWAVIASLLMWQLSPRLAE